MFVCRCVKTHKHINKYEHVYVNVSISLLRIQKINIPQKFSIDANMFQLLLIDAQHSLVLFFFLSSLFNSIEPKKKEIENFVLIFAKDEKFLFIYVRIRDQIDDIEQIVLRRDIVAINTYQYMFDRLYPSQQQHHQRHRRINIHFNRIEIIFPLLLSFSAKE